MTSSLQLLVSKTLRVVTFSSLLVIQCNELVLKIYEPNQLRLKETATNYSEPVQYSLNIKHHFQNYCNLQTSMIPSHNSNLGLLQGNPATLCFSCHKLTILPLPLPQMMFCIQGSDPGSLKSVIIISSLLLPPTIPFDLMLDNLCRLPVKLYLLHLLTLM